MKTSWIAAVAVVFVVAKTSLPLIAFGIKNILYRGLKIITYSKMPMLCVPNFYLFATTLLPQNSKCCSSNLAANMLEESSKFLLLKKQGSFYFEI